MACDSFHDAVDNDTASDSDTCSIAEPHQAAEDAMYSRCLSGSNLLAILTLCDALNPDDPKLNRSDIVRRASITLGIKKAKSFEPQSANSSATLPTKGFYQGIEDLINQEVAARLEQQPLQFHRVDLESDNKTCQLTMTSDRINEVLMQEVVWLMDAKAKIVRLKELAVE